MPEQATTTQDWLQGGPASKRTDRLLAWAGIAGPVLFTAGFLGQELSRVAEFSPVAEPVSALEAGPNGWLQQVNFVVFGLLTFAFAVGLHRGVARSRRGVAGPALLGLSGVGLLMAAAFPPSKKAEGGNHKPGGHVFAGVTFFLSSAVGLVLLSRRLSAAPRWRDLWGYTLGCGVAAVGGFVVLGGLAVPDDAPLHDWAGLAQRILILAVLFPCRLVLSARLLRLARD
jgi:hypothetical membrane protein